MTRKMEALAFSSKRMNALAIIVFILDTFKQRYANNDLPRPARGHPWEVHFQRVKVFMPNIM